ncbi:unnamed protein product, partial [marine sediment metagenome]
DSEKAIEILEKGIESNPSYTFGHSVLANILRARQVPKRAAEEFTKALELDPQMFGDMLNFGLYYLEIKQPQKALQYFSSALKFEPGNSELRGYYDKALAGVNTQDDDLGLSEETTGALSEMFDEGDQEQAESEELPDTGPGMEEPGPEEVKLSDEAAPAAEDLEKADEEGLPADISVDEGEALEALQDSVDVETLDAGEAETEIIAPEDSAQLADETPSSGDVNITSLLKTMREGEEEGAAVEEATAVEAVETAPVKAEW